MLNKRCLNDYFVSCRVFSQKYIRLIYLKATNDVFPSDQYKEQVIKVVISSTLRYMTCTQINKYVSFVIGYCSIRSSTLNISLILKRKVIPSIVFKAMRVVLLLLLANAFVHAFVPGLHESIPIRKTNWLLPNNGETKVIKNSTRTMLMWAQMFL